MFDKCQQQLKKKKVDYLHSYQKLFPFFGIFGKECDLSKTVPWDVILHSQKKPVLVLKAFVNSDGECSLYVRCSQVSPSQPGRQRHVPRTWSQPAAFLHLHTWWQSSPKNPSGQAENAKDSFLAEFLFLFCINFSLEIWKHRALLVFLWMLCHTPSVTMLKSQSCFKG